jgi:hypothetical protein
MTFSADRPLANCSLLEVQEAGGTPLSFFHLIFRMSTFVSHPKTMTLFIVREGHAS